MAAWLLETLPLRHLYAGTPFLTISHSAEEALVELGVARRHHRRLQRCRGERASTPAGAPRRRRCSTSAGSSADKRLEILLDVLAGIPGTHLDIAGEGDHRPALEAEIAARGSWTA